MPEAFYKGAKRTRVGDISHPTKTEYGYHLIKVLDYNPSISLDQARPEIKGILAERYRREKIKSFVDSRLQHPPVIHWDRLGDLYFKNRVVIDWPSPPERP
jgi:hypothetical protein